MRLTKKVLITIGREYGSGGRVIGETLAKDLDMPCFDRNMIAMIAKKHGLDEDALNSSDERLSNPFFDPYAPYGMDAGAISERLFLLQSNIIREEADKGPAIFIGRCANDILRDYQDVVNIFIYASRNDRVERIMKVEEIDDSLAAAKIVKRTDKTRRSYYQFYTDKKWGSTEGMDLMINSSAVGIPGAVRVIEAFLKEKGYVTDEE
ncbi:MAG: cytidylate kinase-like family protein [Lachnospiraceae bacterium]|nr:cytidylate kinase-like family protein [Lachnospiraceae bacterium]